MEHELEVPGTLHPGPHKPIKKITLETKQKNNNNNKKKQK